MEPNTNEITEDIGRILVVDDYPMNRLKIARVLEQLGHEVMMAENGVEAVTLMQTNSLDVVLLDIMMPEMDGYEVLQHMRKDGSLRDIPVIVISAVDEIDSIVRCIEMGAVDYLPKPFNPTILRARIRTSLQRKKLRDLERSYLQQELALRQSEKLATLGRLSAGLAHELNNPAAAVKRGSDQLTTALEKLLTANQELDITQLSVEQREHLNALTQNARIRASQIQDTNSLALHDQEYEVEIWLEGMDLANAWELAPSLVALGYDNATLSRLSQSYSQMQLAPILAWLCAIYEVYVLLEEIGQGSARVADLVGALKTYTYMDQAPVQLVDINRGLDDTLIILRSKLGDGVSVRRDYAEDLPRIEAFGSELNQVWTNLIDNAIDAMAGAGELVIRTRKATDWIVVDIEDNGVGIPESVQATIFDPFFTTKPPGAGTGLGLNISHHIIVEKHEGTITVHSRPGYTCFQIKLPWSWNQAGE